MLYHHAYLVVDGVEYFDYDFYTSAEIRGYNKDEFDSEKEYFLCDETVLRRLEKCEDLGLASITPPKGSEIYITPRMPYPIEDIRHNYNIKRVPDSGAYNVIGPLSVGFRNMYLYGYEIAIFPTLKSIFLYEKDDSNLTTQEIYKKALYHIPNADYADMIFKRFPYWEQFTIVMGFQVYKDVLDKTLTKPTVSYTCLNIAGENPLTTDILELVKQVGSVHWAQKDAAKNLVIQLNVLNQHNWRDYPGTISMLFGEMMAYDKTTVFNEVSRTTSRYSKVIKELLSCKNKDFASEKDFEFARNYVNQLLDIGECRYTSVVDLFAKIDSIHLHRSTFDKLYNNIVRLTPKKYGE